MKKIMLTALLGLFVCLGSNAMGLQQPVEQVEDSDNLTGLKMVNVEECMEILSKVSEDDMTFGCHIGDFEADYVEFYRPSLGKNFKAASSAEIDVTCAPSSDKPVIFPVGYKFCPSFTQEFKVFDELTLDKNTTYQKLVIDICKSLQTDVLFNFGTGDNEKRFVLLYKPQ